MTFPPVSMADHDGLLMVGGQLDPDWLLEAYRRGIFPWPVRQFGRDILAWFSPDPRAILELDEVYVSRRLARRIRRREFEVTCDQAFHEVITACARPRPDQGQHGSWITPGIVRAYGELHRLGYAHSVEAWQDGELAGGIYGVALGGLFAGESMFHRRRDASKVALVLLARHLKRRGFALFDIQQATGHTLSMGAREIPRRTYCRRLRGALELPVTFGSRLEEA